jgi:hypothetical protein
MFAERRDRYTLDCELPTRVPWPRQCLNCLYEVVSKCLTASCIDLALPPVTRITFPSRFGMSFALSKLFGILRVCVLRFKLRRQWYTGTVSPEEKGTSTLYKSTCITSERGDMSCYMYSAEDVQLVSSLFSHYTKATK